MIPRLTFMVRIRVTDRSICFLLMVPFFTAFLTAR